MAIEERESSRRLTEASDINFAHESYHSMRQADELPGDTVAQLGKMMCRSHDVDLLIDGAWALMQAGAESGRAALIDQSRRVGKGIIRLTLGSHEEILARIPGVIAPEYIAAAKGEAPQPDRLASRLKALNSRVLSIRSIDRQLRNGLGAEIAVGYLLNRRISLHPEEFDGEIAWPAFPWQDNNSLNSWGNYDWRLGSDPDHGRKIQVKSNIHQHPRLRSLFEAGKEEEALRGWRKRYDSDITLIFGDVHLGNTRRYPNHINSCIANQTPQNIRQIELATQNILDEITDNHHA